MARSMVSLVIDAFFAASTAMRRRGFMLGSAPLRAATMISLASFVKMRPFAAAASSRPFCFHCAPMPVEIARPGPLGGSLELDALSEVAEAARFEAGR